jgi:hypothetical protein
MDAASLWRMATRDESGLLRELVDLLEKEGVRYAVIGGHAVNAHADQPLIGLDVDLVIEESRRADLEAELRKRLRIESSEDRLNVSKAGSDLRVRIETDPRYRVFVDRASPREVLGLRLTVAIGDVLQEEVWAFYDKKRLSSKRQNDLTDIARMVEKYPELRAQVPHAEKLV